MKYDEWAPGKYMYGVGLQACHMPFYIPKEIIDNEANPPVRPPYPEDEYSDIPDKIEDYIGSTGKSSFKLLLKHKWLGDSYIRHYYGCIRSIDRDIGRLMDYVDSSFRRWFVLLTSDHGYHLLDKGRMTKFTLWRAAT